MLKGTATITFSFNLRKDPPRDCDQLNQPFPFRVSANRKLSFVEENPFVFFKIKETGQNRSAAVINFLSHVIEFERFTDAYASPLARVPTPPTSPKATSPPSPRPAYSNSARSSPRRPPRNTPPRAARPS